MENNNISTFTKVHTTVSFIVMVFVNILANIIPFNGVKTGQVSDSYPNLFAPAGITFSIWGIIYLSLAAYLLYQFGLFNKKEGVLNKEVIEKTGIFFTISSIANTVWIFVWHYRAISISLFMIFIILLCLIIINLIISKANLITREKLLIKLPFSIYFGWITVAVIANFTTFLVSINWNRFGLSDSFYTIIILFLGLVIACLTVLKSQDLAYGLTVEWAYIGILIKHTSQSGHAGRYPFIITVLIICIIILLITAVYAVVADKDKLKNIKLFRFKKEKTES